MQQGNPEAQEELRKLSAQFLDTSLKVQNILAAREAQTQSQDQVTTKKCSHSTTDSTAQSDAKGKVKQQIRIAVCSPDSSPETSTRRLPNSRPSSPTFPIPSDLMDRKDPSPKPNTKSDSKPSEETIHLVLSDSEAEEEEDSASWESGSTASREAGENWNANGTDGTSASNESAGTGEERKRPSASKPIPPLNPNSISPQRKSEELHSRMEELSLMDAISCLRSYGSGQLTSNPEVMKKGTQSGKEMSDRLELYNSVPDGMLDPKDFAKLKSLASDASSTIQELPPFIQDLVIKALTSPDSPVNLQAIKEALERRRLAHIELGFAMAFSTIVAKKTGSMEPFQKLKKSGWKCPTKKQMEESKEVWFEEQWRKAGF